MSNEEFSKLNPIIMGLKEEYSTKKDAYVVQGRFFQTHMFIFDTLEDRMAEIIKLRCGLVDGRCWTLQEIGDYYGLTRERIRTIELNALIKLRHPHRIKLMMEYTDETFNKGGKSVFINDFKSLIRKDIFDNITLESMRFIEDVKITDLEIKKGGNYKQREEDIKNILVQNGIVTGKDLILYLQENGDIVKLGLTDSSYEALLCSICELVDNNSAKATSKQMVSEYIEHKHECEQRAIKESLIKIAEQKRLEEQERQERLKNAFKNPENVSIEDLDFDQRTYFVFSNMGIKTLKDIINHYNDNGGKFEYECYMNPRRQKEIFEKLKMVGIILTPQYKKAKMSINLIMLEDLHFSFRTYNALKRSKINNIEELISFYIKNDASFSNIRNLGVKCEQEILTKMEDLGINVTLTGLKV